MPTGYTADVCDGKKTTLKEFALSCAHAFLVEMREESLDAAIPDEVKIDSYHSKEQAKAAAELERLKKLSTKDARAEMEAEHAKSMDAYKRNVAEVSRTNNRLQGMLHKVLAWDPPTKDHENLKKFMISQLEISMYTYEPEPPVKESSAISWKNGKIHKAKSDIKYHSLQLATEEESARVRTEWIQALKKSLQ
jgi:hypothetical protein